MSADWPRREWLRSTLLASLAASAPARAWAASSPPFKDEVRAFRLVEGAGLRRAGHPIHAVVPDAGRGRNFRLVRSGRPIRAQFRPVEGAGGRVDVALDFVANLAPGEVVPYEVHFGPTVEPGPEGESPLKLEKVGRRLRVAQSSAIAFEVEPDLTGFLRSAGGPALEYFKDASAGLVIKRKGQDPRSLFDKSRARVAVTREGPLAVGLRYVIGDESGHHVTADLTFPSAKSWVQADVAVDDPAGEVESLALTLDLLVEGPKILLDLGAGSTIYAQLTPEEPPVALIAGRALGGASPAAGAGWVILQGSGPAARTYAASTPADPRPAEGWVQVRDEARSITLALDAFGKGEARDRIEVDGRGVLRLGRDFAVEGDSPPKGPKALRFWLHVAPAHVQGGGTSPQSILRPPKVEWDR